MPQPPPNAYKSGTRLTVGSHQVSIIKYISEGGFAHVYTCTIDPPFQGSNVACLKRVVVPSKWQLSLLRQEVDAMRRLRGNKHIVSYIDSHASRLGDSNTSGTNNSHNQQQQYEVFLLMEYCENNGLIDFMNTRLVNKLTEKEIIDIMYQVTIGVAMCHHLRPPLIHRDIKIENVLIDGKGVFKLCDFGSSVNYLPPPRNPQELQLMKDDLMQHTTPQYRAPEMIDLSKGFPIDDKSDIWALGIFLYKLCYYTTPFERPNQSSLQELEHTILNCSETLRFNDQPGSMFSPRLKNAIKVCLRGDPRRRPNAVQLLGEIAAMKGEKTIPNVIPYSVIEQSRAKQTVAPEEDTKKGQVSHVEKNKITSKPKTDPFANIDKSKLLNKSGYKLSSVTAESRTVPARPLSAFFDDGNTSRIYSQGNRSTPSVQDYVKEELAKGESYEFNEPDGTLEFLKSREEEKFHQRNDTGGSFKAAFKNGLRKISTGGNISANNTGSSVKSNRRASLKRIITGGSNHNKKNFEENTKYMEDSNPVSSAPKKLSIQHRMQQLLNQNEHQHIQKSAQGYGKYTDTKASEDIDEINKPTHSKLVQKKLSPPAVPVNLSSQRNRAQQSSLQNTTKKYSVKDSKPLSKVRNIPPKDTVKTKPPPPKPKKPVYLKSPTKLEITDQRRLSDASEISMPDLDDLEKQFSKRFPSYV
ncbi:actin-regulating kinase, putative [Candida dubliniensis CD36]|uniref:non-specific serine/threonine protein kinase n=1 Tax=Candida dubliniensis (strain CD36 / ATCC MYA-646 / CBS 7987 / NCPF 3949 / NRRL Y-17841) TaxID=573826 RepID=B9WL18_CANDC|nr:actin-regulating kinase, putative [Candida dubliniensis CD36]CAX39721.1 actin-regulating kinase, putative [Candida dubliniensis CD36]